MFRLTFERPGVLWALALLFPLGAAMFLHYHFRAPLLRLFTAGRAGKRGLRRRALFSSLAFLAAVEAAILALSGPQAGFRLSAEARHGLDAALAFDISRSMTVEDCALKDGTPVTRIAMASRIAAAAVDALAEAGARFALVIGKGEAVLAVPLTADSEALHAALDNLSPAMMSASSTNLESLVTRAKTAFSGNFPTGRALILFTDGEALSGSLTDSLEALERDTDVIVCGIGSNEGGPVPGMQPPVTSSRDEAGLREAAILSSGFYVDGNSEGAAAQIISLLRKQASSESWTYREEPRRLAPLASFAAALFLGFAILLRWSRTK